LGIEIDDQTILHLAIGVFAALVLFVGIVRQVLFLTFLVVFNALLVYLAWRFVRVHERIARALEAKAFADVDGACVLGSRRMRALSADNISSQPPG
jgi:heme O synthase-like polyprenyltransferase